jgi:hypothetical protein
MGYINADGLYIKRAEDAFKDAEVGVVSQFGDVQRTKIEIKAEDLDGDAVNFPSFAHKIRKGTMVLGGRLIVREAFVGGTSIAVGTYDLDQTTADDADGFLTAATGVTASLTANAEIALDGALVDTTLTDLKMYAVTTVGTFTAGWATVEIDWIADGVDYLSEDVDNDT